VCNLGYVTLTIRHTYFICSVKISVFAHLLHFKLSNMGSEIT
jgi:hypothetical protein